MKKNNIIKAQVTGNQGFIRNMNENLILRLIHQEEPISRVSLSRMTGLNKSTVSGIVARLIEDGMVNETLRPTPEIGRNPLDLAIKQDNTIGGIVIDRSSTQILIASITGKIIEGITIPTELASPELFLAKIARLLVDLQGRLAVGRLRGVGISQQGIVDSGKGILFRSNQLGWENIPVLDIVTPFIPYSPLVVSNDARAAALAEYYFGEHEDLPSDYVTILSGSGIGAGIVINGKPIDGAHHGPGELGHCPVNDEGPICSCGGKGCLETLATSSAIITDYKNRKGIQVSAIDIGFDAVIAAAKNGDTDAEKAIIRASKALAKGLVYIIELLDPALIIIGGDLARAYDVMEKPIRETINTHLPIKKEILPLIVPSLLGSSLSSMGALALAMDAVFNNSISYSLRRNREIFSRKGDPS